MNVCLAWLYDAVRCEMREEHHIKVLLSGMLELGCGCVKGRKNCVRSVVSVCVFVTV